MSLKKNGAIAEEYRELVTSDRHNKTVRSHGEGRAAEISLLELQVLLATQLLSSKASGASIVEALDKNERYIEWPARIYAALDRLEREGLICKLGVEQVVPRRRGRRRSTVKLTSSGHRKLRDSLRILDSLRQDKIY